MLSQHYPQKFPIRCRYIFLMLHKKDQLVAENSEHVPLLVMKQNESSSKSNNCTNKMTNGNGLQLIDNSEQREQIIPHHPQSSHILQSQISPVTLSSSTQSHVMKSRLNQYNTTGGMNSVVVRLSDENGTEVSTTTTGSGKASRSRKKHFAEI